jgi:hypothetical protein
VAITFLDTEVYARVGLALFQSSKLQSFKDRRQRLDIWPAALLLMVAIVTFGATDFQRRKETTRLKSCHLRPCAVCGERSSGHMDF